MTNVPGPGLDHAASVQNFRAPLTRYPAARPNWKVYLMTCSHAPQQCHRAAANSTKIARAGYPSIARAASLHARAHKLC